MGEASGSPLKPLLKRGRIEPMLSEMKEQLADFETRSEKLGRRL